MKLLRELVTLLEADETKAVIDKLELAVQDLKLPKELPVAPGETVDARRRSFMKHLTQLAGSRLLPVSVVNSLVTLAVPQVTAALQAAVAAPVAALATDAKLAQTIVAQVAQVAKIAHVAKGNFSPLKELSPEDQKYQLVSMERPAAGPILWTDFKGREDIVFLGVDSEDDEKPVVITVGHEDPYTGSHDIEHFPNDQTGFDQAVQHALKLVKKVEGSKRRSGRYR